MAEYKNNPREEWVTNDNDEITDDTADALKILPVDTTGSTITV